jgi:transglycosylase-like protein with SLT domain
LIRFVSDSPAFRRKTAHQNRRNISSNPQRAIAPTLQIKLRATHLFTASLLLNLSIELCDDGGCMEGLRLAGALVILSLIIAPAASAQDKGLNDRALRMITRSEAKHVRSRQNLITILREQPNFWVELQVIAKRLKTEPAWLLNVMASESLFDPKARNGLPGQTATGLLQFVESTARSMGTTTEAIRRMSPVEQLRLVEKYLTPFRGRLESLADVYLAVFRGFIVGGGDATVIATLDKSNKEGRVYSLNRWLDSNGDGKITKGELALAALSVGRFQPAAPRSGKSLYRNPAYAANHKPDPGRTRSIYVGSLDPQQ